MTSCSPTNACRYVEALFQWQDGAALEAAAGGSSSSSSSKGKRGGGVLRRLLPKSRRALTAAPGGGGGLLRATPAQETRVLDVNRHPMWHERCVGAGPDPGCWLLGRSDQTP